MTTPTTPVQSITIKLATLTDHQAVSQLFEQYRKFYQKPAAFEQACDFIKQRLTCQDSVIFLASTVSENTSQACGFVQLYPSFSSTNMEKMYILNDLFVDENYRQMAIATKLMNAAKDYAITQKAHSLKLCTAVDNHQAKALYNKLGYQAITTFDHYSLLLNP